MTSSSGSSCTPSAPQPQRSHWDDLTRRLPETVETLETWMDRQLAVLEKRHAKYITRRSLGKSLRGSR